MSARIHSITFDEHERPKCAVVITSCGIVEAEWKCVAGDWCWFTSGTGDAKKLAVPAIERIEMCLEANVRCRCCGRECEDGSGLCDRCERTYTRE